MPLIPLLLDSKHNSEIILIRTTTTNKQAVFVSFSFLSIPFPPLLLLLLFFALLNTADWPLVIGYYGLREENIAELICFPPTDIQKETHTQSI